MKNTLMIDLETLSTTPKAVVVSIGCAGYDREGKALTFHKKLELQSQINKGREISESTLKWWMGQTDDARKEFIGPVTPTGMALADLLGDLTFNFALEELIVFGNGANFDITIIEDLLTTYGYATPWKFTNVRCYRTLKYLVPGAKLVREGTHHTSASDSASQLKHLEEIVKVLDKKLGAKK